MKAPIGAMREVVVVESKTTTSDTQLGRSRQWVPFATIRAAVRVTGSAEVDENGRVTTVTNYEVETRYRTDITSTMRMAWTPFRGSTKTLRIVSGPKPMPGRPERILFDCQEAA